MSDDILCYFKIFMLKTFSNYKQLLKCTFANAVKLQKIE